MTDSVESVIAGRSSKTDENKRSFEALPWKDKEAKNKPFKNYQSGHPVRACFSCAPSCVPYILSKHHKSTRTMPYLGIKWS